MNPYADFLYFGLSLYVLVPSLLAGWVRQLNRFTIIIATLVMLAIQYSTWVRVSPEIVFPTLWLVLGYALFQWLLAAGFLALRRGSSAHPIFYLALLLSLMPLLGAKFIPLVQPVYPLVFLGLSYVTFRCLDVLIGIQDGVIQALAPLEYLAFMLFFPTISSGPVDRFQRWLQDWRRSRSSQEFWNDVDGGVQRIFRGFLYKFILAALIKTYWLDPSSQSLRFLPMASYMYAYSFYLFFDFAGYSAFAIGFSYLFGIHPPENFNRPFIARNIREFWDRWHISLSWWFRDHIYSRFVFAAVKGKWFKNSVAASYLGFLLSMGLMGIWHGTALHYIIYGLYHGVLLVTGDWIGRLNRRYHWWNRDRLFWRAASIALTFNLVCFGLLIFSGRLG